jgi:hypothetical protein
VYYSVWSYLLLAFVALVFGVDREYVEDLYRHYEHDPAELVWRGALLTLLPSALIATTTRAWHGSQAQRRVLSLLRINERHEQPTAWDYFFRQRREAYVRVTLSGGGRVLGYYGRQSFAAYAKDGGDLLLERIYVADEEHGWFGDEVAGSCGVWLQRGEILSVEFYSPQDERAESSETETDSGPTEGRGEEGRPPSAKEHRASEAAAASTET